MTLVNMPPQKSPYPKLRIPENLKEDILPDKESIWNGKGITRLERTTVS